MTYWRSFIKLFTAFGCPPTTFCEVDIRTESVVSRRTIRHKSYQILPSYQSYFMLIVFIWIIFHYIATIIKTTSECYYDI